MVSPPPIQAMDATTLRAVLAELRPVLLPARFEKAQQGNPHGVQLSLRGLEGIRWLELSWLAEAPRLLAIDPPPRRGDGSTLARQLQHALRGLALVALEQHGWERVVELVFAPRPGEPGRRFLVLELMGRRSNLFLLDEERRVIALGHQVRKEQSRLRPIGTGDPYVPPPPMGGEPPAADEAASRWRRRLSLLPVPLKRALMESYQGIGPSLAGQLVAGIDPEGGEPMLERSVSGLSENQWHGLWRHWQLWLKAVEEERFRLGWGGPSDHRCWEMAGATPIQAGAVGGEEGNAEAEAGQTGESLPINRGLARYYGERLSRRDLEQRRESLRQRLGAAAGRECREAARQEELLAAVPGSEALQHRADALLSLPVPDRDQIAEAQKLYRQARRLRRSLAAITPRLEHHRQRSAAIEASLTYLEQAEDSTALDALEEELGELLGRREAGSGGKGSVGGEPTGRRERSTSAPMPLELRTPAGLRLQVGRNHRQNEWISLRQARRGDLWFHAQECPGSHVVLKGSEGTAVEADLAAAADLAAHFSRGRGNARVPVVMVPTHELQRIPGAGPGTVRHRGGEILWGRPSRALALLEREGEDPPKQLSAGSFPPIEAAHGASREA